MAVNSVPQEAHCFFDKDLEKLEFKRRETRKEEKLVLPTQLSQQKMLPDTHFITPTNKQLL